MFKEIETQGNYIDCKSVFNLRNLNFFEDVSCNNLKDFYDYTKNKYEKTENKYNKLDETDDSTKKKEIKETYLFEIDRYIDELKTFKNWFKVINDLQSNIENIIPMLRSLSNEEEGFTYYKRIEKSKEVINKFNKSLTSIKPDNVKLNFKLAPIQTIKGLLIDIKNKKSNIGNKDELTTELNIQKIILSFKELEDKIKKLISISNAIKLLYTALKLEKEKKEPKAKDTALESIEQDKLNLNIDSIDWINEWKELKEIIENHYTKRENLMKRLEGIKGAEGADKNIEAGSALDARPNLKKYAVDPLGKLSDGISKNIISPISDGISKNIISPIKQTTTDFVAQQTRTEQEIVEALDTNKNIKKLLHYQDGPEKITINKLIEMRTNMNEIQKEIEKQQPYFINNYALLENDKDEDKSNNEFINQKLENMNNDSSKDYTNVVGEIERFIHTQTPKTNNFKIENFMDTNSFTSYNQLNLKDSYLSNKDEFFYYKQTLYAKNLINTDDVEILKNTDNVRRDGNKEKRQRFYIYAMYKHNKNPSLSIWQLISEIYEEYERGDDVINFFKGNSTTNKEENIIDIEDLKETIKHVIRCYIHCFQDNQILLPSYHNAKLNSEIIEEIKNAIKNDNKHDRYEVYYPNVPIFNGSKEYLENILEYKKIDEPKKNQKIDGINYCLFIEKEPITFGQITGYLQLNEEKRNKMTNFHWVVC